MESVMFLKRIDFKITFWHLLLLICSLCILFVIFYFLFSKSLNKRDHEVLEARFQEYFSIYSMGGVKSLDANLNSDATINGQVNFFIRIAGTDHKTIYFYTPKKTSLFDPKEIEVELYNVNDNQRWYYIKTASVENDLEVLSYKTPTNIYFQIGKTIVDRDVLLNRFTKNFVIVVAIAIILGGMGGIFLSGRMLRPLRNLIKTLQSLRTGNDEARVPNSHSNDELEDLTILFNQMLDRIQTTNRAMRQTLDTIAHELRTPLTSVRGLAEVTLRKTNYSEQDYRRVLEDCIEGIDEILTEFKMITDITEVESGLQNLNKENIDLRSVCQDVIDLYEFVAEQKEIHIDLTPEAQFIVFADKKKLRQVVANLLDNAIKYSPSSTNIHISLSETNRITTLNVADQGIGIPENEVPLIWKRLYRGDKARTEKGIGLGLSLVKSIVEAHQGIISVEKNKERGTAFIVRLPSS